METHTERFARIKAEVQEDPSGWMAERIRSLTVADVDRLLKGLSRTQGLEDEYEPE